MQTILEKINYLNSIDKDLEYLLIIGKKNFTLELLLNNTTVASTTYKSIDELESGLYHLVKATKSII